MQNVIHFPIRKSPDPPAVDWDRIETLRHNQYPGIPAEAVRIIRRIWETETGARERTDWRSEIKCEHDGYLPDDIDCAPNEADTVWLIDLLDRYGGELICGDAYCIIAREQKRLPMFWINKIDPISLQGMEQNSDCVYEHYMECRHNWRILGKVIPDSRLILVLIRFFADDALKYGGLIDAATFLLLLNRVEQGTRIEKAFILNNNERSYPTQ